MPAVSWPERGHLLGLDQPVLGAAQIGECGLGGGARAARFLAAGGEFLEQPRVLDREHRLPGEGLQQGRDGRREAADRAPADHQPADDLVLAQQRHRQNGMDAFQQSPAVGVGECGSCCTSSTCTGARSTAARPRWVSPSLTLPFAQCRHPLGAHAKGGFGHEDFLGLVEFVDRAFIGLRELRRAADDRGEHGVEVERGIDRAQHFLERLQFGDRAGQLVGAGLQFAEQPRVLDRDDRLVGEGAHQLDLPVGERLDRMLAAADRSCRSRPPSRSSGTPSMVVARPTSSSSGVAA